MITWLPLKSLSTFRGLVIGFTSAGNVRRRRPFFADTLLWVSQREAVREVSRLLRCLAERRWPLVPRHQRQSVSFRQRAPAQPPGDADD